MGKSAAIDDAVQAASQAQPGLTVTSVVSEGRAAEVIAGESDDATTSSSSITNRITTLQAGYWF